VDAEAPGVVTLPEHLKRHGYYTISNGKVYHDHGDDLDAVDGWSELPWEPHPGFFVWRKPENAEHNFRGYKYTDEYFEKPGPLFEAADIPDDGYPTGVITEKTIQDLHRLKRMQRPFFLAVGYRKPHLPFNAPKEYWDLYDPDSIRLPENGERRVNTPEVAYHSNPELYAYGSLERGEEIDEKWKRKLLHGYYASVSYTDAQIGKLLRELKKLGLEEDTIVVLWGDHGFQLGEHGLWGKICNFHESLNAPLIIKVPGKREGEISEALVEFVDLYPTLCELTGLSLPGHLQGLSFAGLMDRSDPNWKDAVFARNGTGETVITNRYIYTEWWNRYGGVYTRMLFDLKKDPLEMHNIAEDPEMQSAVQVLSRKIATAVRNR
jgi:arylsulfatase A-like enzyme